jgi:DNA polymerase-3 subunit epsilon
MKNLFQSNITSENSRLTNVAIKLALLFSEEKDTPLQYRKKQKQQKTSDDSQLMLRFKKNVSIWEGVISKILTKNESKIAWRFVNIDPLIKQPIDSASSNQDFISFTDYLILRRDIENCGANELGRLIQLYSKFQQKIEKDINKNNPDFVAVDFEYATRNKGTVCSVGIVSFKNKKIIDEYYSLIQPPENKYEWFTTKTHKLNAILTENAKTFSEIYPQISRRLKNNIVIAHGAFHTDKVCLEQAMKMNDINDVLSIDWKCTQQICDCGLQVACKVCNIELDHHQALSDAKGCGLLYLEFLDENLPFEEFRREKETQKNRTRQKTTTYPKQLTGDILKPDFENAENKDNPFFMKKVVISGFKNSDKDWIAVELKKLGADIDTSVGKRTNYLIIGENVGPSKLSKMQQNIKEGKEALIIDIKEYNELKKSNIPPTKNIVHAAVSFSQKKN